MKLLTYLKEVKLEASKVTWPAPKEAAAVSGLVLLVVAISALMFVIVDTLVYKFVQLIFEI